MIPRYSRPEMVALWSPETKFRIWFEIEAHACDAQAAIGVIPKANAEAVWRALGAQVLRMTPQAHDTTYAAVSHLPHLLAFAYMNGLAAQPEGAKFLAMAGPGFRDFTRIAASDPSVWRDILLTNREEVLAQSRHFRAALEVLEQSLTDQRADVLVPLIEQAKQQRSAWRLPASKNVD